MANTYMKRKRRGEKSTLAELATAITGREGLEAEMGKRRLASKKELVAESEDWEAKRWRPMESWEGSDVEVTAMSDVFFH